MNKVGWELNRSRERQPTSAWEGKAAINSSRSSEQYGGYASKAERTDLGMHMLFVELQVIHLAK